MDRRRFLVAAIVFGTSAGTLRSLSAWAQAGTSVAAGAREPLVRMARNLYPHDGLDDSVYGQILDDALSATAVDTSLTDTFAAAESALDAQRNVDFVDLDESEQIAVMRALETEAFFVAIQTAVRLRLYNHPAFWNLIGYEGPSWQRGGYLNRGAGEIDWLPEEV